MINVKFTRNSKNQIVGFSLSGHAGFDQYGKDILCAGVSTLSQGIVNGLTEVVKIKPLLTINEGDGVLKCDLPSNLSDYDMDRAQLLLLTLEINLTDLQKSYKKYINITQTKEV
jgi:uncharacterized protein